MNRPFLSDTDFFSAAYHRREARAKRRSQRRLNWRLAWILRRAPWTKFTWQVLGGLGWQALLNCETGTQAFAVTGAGNVAAWFTWFSSPIKTPGHPRRLVHFRLDRPGVFFSGGSGFSSRKEFDQLMAGRSGTSSIGGG